MAELKLRVSLDTSYLKGQISRLPLEFAGANVSIRPKFDKQTIVNEFRLLNRYISSKKFNIVINTNLEAEIKNADRLIKALGRVQQAAGSAKGGLPIGTQVLSRTKARGGFAAAEIKALFGAAVQGGLIDDKTLAATRAQMVAALGSIGKDSIAGLLNGLKSGDADIQAAAQMLGNNLITSFKTVLGIASPSKEFKKLGEAAGQGFEQGLLKSIEIAEQSATRKMQRMLDRLARMALIMSGMSGPEISRQIAQARALPSLNFAATTPRTSVGIGPSSTGRTLTAAAERISLPGTSFASQKLLSGDLLTPSMKASIRDVANDFVDGIRQKINAAIRQIKVEDLGRVSQRMLAGSRVAGYLPPVARFGEGRSPNPYSTGRLGREGETRTELFARREREARMRSALRGVDVMGAGPSRAPATYSRAYRASPSSVSAIVPYAAGGAIVPSASGGGGGIPPTPPRGGGGGGSFGGMQFNMPRLPGAGLVREIGEEFGFAAKQVLLFGTAYKALAFIQGFPAQVGAAVGALQSFRNTIQAISPSAEEAAASSQFILDVVDKYNTPIQSARDGFTKLYASMKPTGFSGDEIRDLFLGISQAAATFGMSAEKVDRVNYAFAQMASKGQVMSEELKGQLGDVLPGAMGIFAEAAGFKGPDAITKFSKALEDGAYKGAAMKTLLTNVGSIMREEFGPGAEGAARTFQGVMNRMQNSTKLLYEAFEPVAVGFLNSVVMPLTSGLKTITDGFNAFFTGVNAKTAGGFAFAQELEKLRPTFEGLRTNAIGLAQVFGEFAKVALGVSSALLQIAGNPIVGYMAKIYAIIVPLNMALGVMRGLWALNSLQLLLFNARVAMGVPTLSAFRGMMQATGATAAVTATSIRTAGLTLRTFFASTGVGLVLVGISALIERFMSMNQALADTRAKALGAAQAIRSMSQTEARQAANQAATDVKLLQGVSQREQVAGSKGRIVVSPQEKAALERAGVSTETTATRQRGPEGFRQTVGITQLRGAIESRQGMRREAEYRQRQINFEEQQLQQPVDIAPIPPVGAESGAASGKGAAEKRVPLEQLLDMESQRIMRLNLSKADLRLTQLITAAKLQGNDAEAESLEGLSNSLQLRIKLTAAQDFVNTLLDKEGEIIGKSLTKEQFSNKLQEANVEVELLSNDLKASYLEMQVKENEADKRAQKALSEKITQQLSLNRLLEDAAISAGVVSPQQAAISGQRRGFQDQLLQAKELGATPEQMLSLEAFQAATPQAGSLQEALRGIENELNKLISTQEMVKTSASAIGDAFGNAFKGIITGSMTAREALAGFFQSVADSFADMAAKMIAEWTKMQIIGLVQSLLAPVVGGFAGAFGSSGPSFNAGAFSGPALSGGLSGAANYSSAFSGGMGGFNSSSFITGFANGGVVTGPTLGLVGEGKYNEAVIPLPDGKSVPVQLSGGDGGNQINSNITVNVSNGQAQSNATGSNSSELGRKIEGAVKQVIVGELRPGGLLASR
jgi:tape measure domain-containing protein